LVPYLPAQKTTGCEEVAFKKCPSRAFIMLKATSKNVIPAKAGIQNPLTSLDSRLRGSDKLIIIRGSLKFLEAEKVMNKKLNEYV
jgi:hypothetical protein